MKFIKATLSIPSNNSFKPKSRGNKGVRHHCFLRSPSLHTEEALMLLFSRMLGLGG